MKTTKKIIESLRECAGDDFDCTKCVYYDAGTEHLERLHLDAAAELERMNNKLTWLRQAVVDNINKCSQARDVHKGSVRSEFSGCIVALNFVLRWINEEGKYKSEIRE